MRNSKLQLLLAVAAMFFLVVGILLTSVQIAVYGDREYRFYEKEYEKYKVTDDLGMQMADVMDVTVYMMDYLIGKEETLSVVTDVDGREQDFFNEQDRLHMADVRNLFLGGLRLRNILFGITAVLLLLLVFWKADVRGLLFSAYRIAMAVFGAAVVFLGIAFTVNFTECFRIFHEMFFTNDLWLFDPATDYMIRMLPEGFFSDMAVRIFLVFMAVLLILGVILRILRGQRKKNKT